MSGGGFAGDRNHLPAELAAQILEREAAENRAASPDEKLLLDRLIEECAEVIQAACKISRFGWTVNPYTKVDPITHLSHEIGHATAAITMLHNARMVSGAVVEESCRRKLAQYRTGIAGELRPASE